MSLSLSVRREPVRGAYEVDASYEAVVSVHRRGDAEGCELLVVSRRCLLQLGPVLTQDVHGRFGVEEGVQLRLSAQGEFPVAVGRGPYAHLMGRVCEACHFVVVFCHHGAHVLFQLEDETCNRIKSGSFRSYLRR